MKEMMNQINKGDYRLEKFLPVCTIKRGYKKQTKINHSSFLPTCIKEFLNSESVTWEMKANIWITKCYSKNPY